MISKNTIINIALTLWIVVSVGYIGYDLFSKYSVNIMQKSYIAGQTDTVNNLIKEAKKGCDGFNVYSGNQEVNLINIECLNSNPQKNNPEVKNK